MEGVEKLYEGYGEAIWRLWEGYLDCGEAVLRVWGGYLKGVQRLSGAY